MQMMKNVNSCIYGFLAPRNKSKPRPPTAKITYCIIKKVVSFWGLHPLTGACTQTPVQARAVYTGHIIVQWRRSVVKYGVSFSQVKPSNCFKRLEKLVLHSTFDTNLSSLMTWNLLSYPATVLNEMKVGDILGVKTYSDPSYIFSGGQQPQLPGSTPLSLPPGHQTNSAYACKLQLRCCIYGLCMYACGKLSWLNCQLSIAR